VTYDDRTEQEAVTRPLLDSAFQPAEVVVCQQGARTTDGGDPETINMEQRANDISALIAAMRKPDDAPPTAAADNGVRLVCTQAQVYVPWLAVINAKGQWIHPGLPRDNCGAVTNAVIQEIQRLTPTSTTTTRPSTVR
jgi:hypothetical protein